MRIGRIWFVIASFVFAAGALAWVNREFLVLTNLGANTEKRTLQEQEALLEPYLHVFPPSVGSPPFPVVIQFPGCAGYRPDFMQQWAKIANENGYMAIGVDSHGPRGIDRPRAFATVCKGKELIGQERAGDVVAAIALTKARDDVDRDRVIIAGWSHGAWSIMDYLALSNRGAAPPSIEDYEAPPADLSGVILTYPYCGAGSWSRISGWAQTPPVLAMIAGKDTIVDGPDCKRRLEKLERAGASIDIVFYPDADHVFDDRGLEEEYRYMYDAESAADAEARYAEFLRAR